MDGAIPSIFFYRKKNEQIRTLSDLQDPNNCDLDGLEIVSDTDEEKDEE